MESLFNPQTTQNFIARIHRLSPQTQAQWGKMSVDQMLLHCQRPLEIAAGQLKPKVNPLIKFLFGKSARKEILSPLPFKRNLPTMGEAKIAERQNFELEKQNLINRIESFQKNGPEGITKEPHPFFGDMSVEDWDMSQVKHLDHHLKQFGV